MMYPPQSLDAPTIKPFSISTPNITGTNSSGNS